MVRAATADDVDGCVAVLAALPAWFTASTHDDVRADLAAGRGWVADEGTVIGCVVATQRFPAAAEITFAAVVPDRRGTGAGTALVERAVADLAADGVRVVEVKTLDATAGYEPYVATRAFWTARRFLQVDLIDPLPGWSCSPAPAASFVGGGPLGPRRKPVGHPRPPDRLRSRSGPGAFRRRGRGSRRWRWPRRARPRGRR